MILVPSFGAVSIGFQMLIDNELLLCSARGPDMPPKLFPARGNGISWRWTPLHHILGLAIDAVWYERLGNMPYLQT